MIRPLAFVTALLLAPAAGAQGQQCPATQTIPLSVTNWQLPLTFPKFDPALGALLSVQYSMTSQVSITARFESLDAKPSQVTLQRSGLVVLRDPSDMTTLLSSNPVDVQMESVAAFDGSIDFMGGSGRTYPAILLNEVVAGSSSDPAILAQFIGPSGNPGTVSLPAAASGTSLATGPGNIVTQISTDAGVAVTICYNYAPDCNGNGVPDSIDIANGAPDNYGPPGTCVADGIPDSCQPRPDCDQDGIPDRCELPGNDCDTNGLPDNCQPDCDNDGIANACEILGGAADLYGAGTCVPDGVPDSCQPAPDCDQDGIPDPCEIQAGAADNYGAGTCTPDGIPDVCQPAGDCDSDGIPDYCEIAGGAVDTLGPGCTPDGIPDSCQTIADCDSDGLSDACEVGSPGTELEFAL